MCPTWVDNSVALPFFGKKNPPAASSDRAAPGSGDAPKSPSPPRTELSALDFSRGDSNRALAQCAGMVEVQEVAAGIGAVYEEAAVLYANGADAEAEKVLGAVLGDGGSTAGEGLWMMLLDLYRLTGQRQNFEARVLDYATQFERSPPPWEDLSSQGERRRGDTTPMVTLSGSLSAQVAGQFQQVGIIGRKSGAVRIDLARLRAVDDQGCGLLRKLLAQLAADRVKVALLNGRGLADMLAGQIEVGKAEARDSWLLLLELLQYTADCERFEQLAIDYAVTFEESPPSWEQKAVPPAATAVEGRAAATGDGSDFRLEGELGGASNEVLRKLAAFAAERRAVVVDCSRLRRIDFVCAGTLFNILATLQAQGKLVELHNVNAMVGALLRVMSVDQVAQVTLRV
ncbi:sulfate transporter [Azoarcus sp. DD4]|nr:sulfate transporter [Azoarcus sp. DD4]